MSSFPLCPPQAAQCPGDHPVCDQHHQGEQEGPAGEADAAGLRHCGARDLHLPDSSQEPPGAAAGAAPAPGGR